MRYLISTIFLFLIAHAVKAVELDSLIVKDSIYITADVSPSFATCPDTLSAADHQKCTHTELFSQVFRELRYPREAREIKKEGTAVASFVVNKDGSMSDITIIKNPGSGLGGEVFRILNVLKDELTWTPAIKDGEPVRFKYVLPVKFRLDGQAPKADQDMFLVFKAWGGKEVFRGMVTPDVQDAIPGKFIKNIETYDIAKSKAVYNVIGSANIVHFRPKKLARPQELIGLKSVIMDELLPKGMAASYMPTSNNVKLTFKKVEKKLKYYIHNYIGEVFDHGTIKSSNGHIEKIDVSSAPEGVLFISLADQERYASVLVVKK